MFAPVGSEIAEWQQRLSAALGSDSGLDDAERVDLIRALEELVCAATAAQAQLSAELDVSQRAQQAAAGVPAAQQGRGVAHQVALARRESPHRAQRHLALARVVADELPHTWRAWREGRITEWTATLVARETACLSQADRRAVDTEVAGDPEALERMGVRQVVAACMSAGARLDPASVVERRRRAEEDRRVTLRPAPDTMTWLTALLPVKEGVAVFAALSKAADRARASGDDRGRGQVMADSLVESVLGPAGREAVGVQLNLVMTDIDLLGGGDEGAQLEGCGPIPAELARELVVSASRDEQVWVRRLFARPTTGELAATDARARRFPAGLARFIRLRDQICRTPWCTAPIRHVDHVVDHASSGPTSVANGQGLCESCNHAKQAPGWRASPVAGGGHLVETITPTGHAHRSRSPLITTVRRGPPIRIDYVLAG